MEVARLAEALAREGGRTCADEACLGGLIHDGGRLAVWKLPGGVTKADTARWADGCDRLLAGRRVRLALGRTLVRGGQHENQRMQGQGNGQADEGPEAGAGRGSGAQGQGRS